MQYHVIFYVNKMYNISFCDKILVNHHCCLLYLCNIYALLYLSVTVKHLRNNPIGVLKNNKIICYMLICNCFK